MLFVLSNKARKSLAQHLFFSRHILAPETGRF